MTLRSAAIAASVPTARVVVALTVVVTLAVPARGLTAVPVSRGRAAGPVPVVMTYAEPVSPLTVLRGFSPPLVRYGPGHLGVDLRSRVGAPVSAAGNGTVTFAGQVAGRGVVVIVHPDGVRTEYEPVTPLVSRGVTVHRGEVVARLRGTHLGCDQPCLHWGARRGELYIDPLSLLRPLGHVTLLPW